MVGGLKSVAAQVIAVIGKKHQDGPVKHSQRTKLGKQVPNLQVPNLMVERAESTSVIDPPMLRGFSSFFAFEKPIQSLCSPKSLKTRTFLTNASRLVSSAVLILPLVP